MRVFDLKKSKATFVHTLEMWLMIDASEHACLRQAQKQPRQTTCTFITLHTPSLRHHSTITISARMVLAAPRSKPGKPIIRKQQVTGRVDRPLLTET
jgi:hypothetical protein